jgi:hypothetical protein
LDLFTIRQQIGSDIFLKLLVTMHPTAMDKADAAGPHHTKKYFLFVDVMLMPDQCV